LINLDAVPIQNKILHSRKVGEEIIIISSDGEELHCLDEIAMFIWENIDGVKNVNTILDNICNSYEVSRAVAKKDLLRFVDELVKKGMVIFEGK
jgi:hypothetical protein